jgi:hypothetical protein
MKRYAFLLILVLTAVIYWAHAADEITATDFLKVDNGELDWQVSEANAKFDQAEAGMSIHVQAIGTGTHELITIPSDIGTNGWARFKNITTNTDRYVQIGIQDDDTNFYAFLELEATEFMKGPLHPTNAIYALAYVGTVNLKVVVLEE